MKKILLSFFAGISLFSSIFSMEAVKQEDKKVVIFDLGGLFFETNSLGFVSNIGQGSTAGGIWKILKYAAVDWGNPLTDIQTVLFKTLDKIPLKEEAGFLRAQTKYGQPMPYALCAYQSGRISSDELRQLALKTCDELQLTHFYSLREKEIIRNTIEAIFTPATQIKNMSPLHKGIEILKQVAAQKNPDGSKKFAIYALSNWDKESFKIIKDSYKDVWDCFDDIIITGEIGAVKPNKAAYEAIFKRHPEVKKEQCFFIDDQKENVLAAEQFGIRSSLVGNKDAYSLELVLRGLNILP